MFYKQLLRAQIRNLKKTDNLTVFFALLGSAPLKAACKTLMKLTAGDRLRQKASQTNKVEIVSLVYLAPAERSWVRISCLLYSFKPK